MIGITMGITGMMTIMIAMTPIVITFSYLVTFLLQFGQFTYFSVT